MQQSQEVVGFKYSGWPDNLYVPTFKSLLMPIITNGVNCQMTMDRPETLIS